MALTDQGIQQGNDFELGHYAPVSRMQKHVENMKSTGRYGQRKHLMK